MGQSTDAYLFFGIEAAEEMTEEDLGKALGIERDKDDWEWLNHALPEGLIYDTHCHCECQIPFICIESTFKTAWRGNAVRIDGLPELDVKLVAKLNELNKKLGWKSPSWYIASDWS